MYYWYGYANRLVIVLILLCTVCLVLKNKLYRRPLAFIAGILCTICLPLAVCFLFFVFIRRLVSHTDGDGSLLYLPAIALLSGTWL